MDRARTPNRARRCGWGRGLPSTIKELRIVLQDPKAQLPGWIAALPQLEVLELWGRHLKKGDLKHLRELER